MYVNGKQNKIRLANDTYWNIYLIKQFIFNVRILFSHTHILGKSVFA